MKSPAENKKENKASANNIHPSRLHLKPARLAVPPSQDNIFQNTADASPQAKQLKAFQKTANEGLQNQGSIVAVAQKKENKTGLPDGTKSAIENLSGYAMDDVKVHYNSSKPAQLNAHAYAQGTEIHLAPGQEKHLGHEAWHVVQQKEGRVAPTTMLKGGVNINDSPSLEQEADKMGAIVQRHSKTSPYTTRVYRQASSSFNTIQRAPEDINMNAGQEDLKDNYKRKIIVDGIYKYIKENYLQQKLPSLGPAKRYLKEEYTGSKFNKFREAGDGEQTAMTKEILARVYHDNTASDEITPEMRSKLGRGQALSEEDEDTVGPDITASTVKNPNKKEGRNDYEIDSKMTTAKACVITALMFSEGGGVLGAKSVEELHFLLSTRFNSTWRHYSEDNVYKSLYEHLGYRKSVPQSPTSLENLASATSGKSHGMASIGGHMVGFKMDGELYIRDNDEGLKKPNQHSKKIKQITALWTK